MPESPLGILIDSSIWIQGQRDLQWFVASVAGEPDLASCDAAVGEYSVGLYAPREKNTRDQVREFFMACVAPVRRLPHIPDDFSEAARLIGEAIFASAAKPSFPDGLIAAVARRTGRIVWTADETDFQALGCQTFNPWAHKPPVTV